MKKNKYIYIVTIFFCLQTILSCGQSNSKIAEFKANDKKEIKKTTMNNEMQLDTAVVGGGCFWCTEAQYLLLDGVVKVESGFSGGNTKNPTYKDICTGTTNHAEVIRITFDKNKLSFDDILYAFWQSHDPTTLNKQGADEGTQYRSVIFYKNENQKQIAEDYIKKLNTEKAFANPIVTQVSMLSEFYIAEDYHQDYYNNNKNAGYCMFVVGPKVEKFKKVFADKLKK
jgi:peptide-methionine (S)-S-oxide reductase